MPVPVPLTHIDNLREGWPGGESEFTSWLTTQDNLERLGRSLGLDLDLLDTEKRIGTLRADIVCNDTRHGSQVFIENYLETFNHDHLGKALTYAGSEVGADQASEPVTVIWVAKTFRPQHRETVRWLNKVTSEHVRLYAVEIRLWRIVHPDLGSEFVVVSQPDDPPVESDPVNETFVEFWNELNLYLEKQDVKDLNRPGGQSFNQRRLGTVGTAGCDVRVTMTPSKGNLRVALFVGGRDSESEDAAAIGNLLFKDRDAIESELDYRLDWKLPPELKSAVISVTKSGFDLRDPNDRNRQYDWISDRLREFDALYRDHVQSLNPSDFVPEDLGEEPDDPDARSE